MSFAKPRDQGRSRTRESTGSGRDSSRSHSRSVSRSRLHSTLDLSHIHSSAQAAAHGKEQNNKTAEDEFHMFAALSAEQGLVCQLFCLLRMYTVVSASSCSLCSVCSFSAVLQNESMLNASWSEEKQTTEYAQAQEAPSTTAVNTSTTVPRRLPTSSPPTSSPIPSPAQLLYFNLLLLGLNPQHMLWKYKIPLNDRMMDNVNQKTIQVRSSSIHSHRVGTVPASL